MLSVALVHVFVGLLRVHGCDIRACPWMQCSACNTKTDMGFHMTKIDNN